MNVVVYTCIASNFEKPKPVGTLAATMARREGVRFVLFSNACRSAPSGWELAPLAFQHDVPRRAARWHKTHSHRLFPDAHITLWHDGSHQLIADPLTMIRAHFPPDVEFASFRHPQRRTASEEAQACIKLRKDDAAVIMKQMRKYRDEGFPDTGMLFETACVLRRRNAVTDALNEAWWSEIRDGSLRDQISLPYCLWKHCAACTELPGSRDNSEFFLYTPHR